VGELAALGVLVLVDVESVLEETGGVDFEEPESEDDDPDDSVEAAGAGEGVEVLVADVDFLESVA